MPDWVVVGVDPEAVWVEGETEVVFRNRRFLLRPPGEETWPDIATTREAGETYEIVATLIHRFLSVMVWKRKAYIRVAGHGGGSPHAFRVGGRTERVGLRVTHHPGYDHTDLPAPTTPQQDLALALYREATGLTDSTYAFLGLFRIFNITLQTPQAQIAWLNAHLPALQGYPGERRQQLQGAHADVGAYLYAAGRSALAHASVPPVVDPDVMIDTHRLGLDGVLLQELVEDYMESALRIPRY